MASTTFVINDSSTGTSNPLVQISIAENGDGTVTFTVTQLVYAGAYLGDLRGLFFDLARENLIGTLSVVGAPAHFTELQQGNDTVKDLGQGANMQGLLGSDGGYDVGIEIGTSGIGKDDVRSFGFTLSSSAGALTLADFAEVDFGVRITSVGQDINGNGTIDTARTESAKIGETTDPTGGNTDDGDATLTVIGTAQEDSTLTASFGNDDPDGAATAGPAYQWYRDGLAISGATASTYLLGDDDVGATITVVANYTDGEGFAEAVASAPTAIVLARDDGDATVTIAGTAQEDATLTASFGNTDPDGAASGITYQWQRNGIEISGATASTYLLGDDDVGATITVVASYTDGQGFAETVESAGIGPVVNVDDEATGTLAVSGAAQEGGSLLAALTGVGDTDGATTTAYRWKELIGGIWIDIPGAGTDLLSIPSDQSYVGKEVRAVATTTDVLGGTTEFVGAGQTILNVNDAPTAAPVDLGAIAEDGSRLITAAELLAGVSDVDGPAATITSLTVQTGGGVLTDNLNGTWSYTPAADDDTSVVFFYTASDGEFSASSTASLDLTAINDAPTAVPVDLGAIAEDGSRLITAAELLAGLSDVDGPAAAITALTVQSGSGELTDNLNGTWSYTPAADDDTSVVFSYTASDGEFSATSTASLDLTSVNDAPTAAPVDLGVIGEDGSRLITAAELLAGVSDVDGPAAAITALAIQAGGGVLTDNLNGTWSYMPAADDDTSVTFSYTASDGEFSASSTASLDLTPVNDAPTITAPNGGAPVTVSVAENTTAVADVDANDPDAGDMLAYSIVETAGTDFDKFAINSAGILTFLVAPDFELPADVGGIAGDNIYVVEVQVADGQGGFDTQTITLEVSNVNEGPVAVGDNIFTTDTTEVPFGKWLLLYNDYDPEGDPIDVTNVGGATGFVFITPPTLPSNYLAIHDNSAPFNYGTFTYQATDGTTPGNVATVNVGLSATGTSGDDILIGNNAGSDLLNGGDGNDILIGQSLGFDTLQGGNGDDLYAFQTVNLGLGAQNTDSGDTIIDTSGTDTIAFATFGSSFGDSFLPFTVYRPDVSTGSFNHLVFSNGGHTIVNFRAVVSNHFAGNPIEKIQFVGGAQLKGYALAATPYTLLANTALAPLNGTSGNDFMVGIYLLNNVFNAVGEELNGGDGDDVIMGNAGIDILRGGAGNDFLVGGTENNTFVFDLTDGHDMVSDNEFNNLYVFNTNGIAFTQFEFERVQDAWPSTSTTESDLVFRYEGQSIQIQEFSSMPVGRIQFAGGASVHGYDLGGGVYTFVGLVGASAGADFRVGTDGADSLGTISFQTGSGGNDVLYGLGGDDTLYGGANDDLLVGGTGDDTYVIDGPSDGVDTVFDESGTADRIHFDGAVANLPINFAHSGDDLLLTYGVGQQMTVLDHYAGFGRGVERLQFASGTTYAGYVLPNTVFFIDADLDGDADQNVIISADSGEALMGQGGVDLLFGNGGSDVLNGGTENDLLVGGLDDDTYQFGGAHGSDTIFDAGGGADGIVFTDAGNETLTALDFDRPSGTNLTITINSSTITVFNQFTAGNSIESVTFDGGATVFGYALSSSPYIIDPGLGGSGNGDIIASNSAAQALTGQGGGDLLFGNGGSDSPIDGGDGDDLLVGGTGSDVMSGGAGDDVLYGGTNNIGSGDSMAGGDGDDRFYFAGAGDSSFLSIDVISGFVAGGAIDEINLDAFNFTGTAVAALKETTPGSFVGSSAADFFDDGGTDRAVAVEYLGGNARVYVDANSDGNFTTADLVVQLNTIAVNALTIDDFMFN